MIWNKIKTENDLPKVRGKYHICENGNYIGEFYFFNASYRKSEMMKFSHWAEIIKPQNP